MTQTAAVIPEISKKKLKSIVNDEEKTALAAKLVYVNDSMPGIERRKKNGEFVYFYKGKPVKDDEELLRIKQLVIPPAWERVWICRQANGHLQATGYDVKNRKQYRYHASWNKVRNHTKFYRMISFGKALPGIRLRLEKDLAAPGLGLEKVLATVVSLMERTHIRIGNAYYEKENGSYGLTTLKDRHVKINGSKVHFSFMGKKGIEHELDLKSKRLSKIIKKCRDIPGRELFQFYDESGARQSIDSGMVNNYIREISGSDFTAKDFRTWAGTVQAFLALSASGCCESQAEAKRKIVEALDIVSNHLGNTRTVCKNYYVHPIILSLYESGKLENYTAQLEKMEKNDGKASLTAEEKIVMKILESN